VGYRRPRWLHHLEDNVGAGVGRSYLPVPKRFTLCGLPGALSVKVSVPVTAPVVVGEKVTPTVQPEQPAILAPQGLLATAKPVVLTMPVELSATFSRLVSVTVFIELVLPTTTVPRLRNWERVTGALPEPLRLTV
jgi:hypothetical protein